MSADSPRRTSGGSSRGFAVPATVPPQVVSDRSILDSAIGFINDVTLAHPSHTDPKDMITWARFETVADISDARYGDDWELEGNVAPPLLLILGYGLGVQVWAIPANGEAVEVLSWRHGIVSALRVLPTPAATQRMEEHGRSDEMIDQYAEKRPLIALVDGSTSANAGPQFCAVNFVSLKTGTQVKAIKFKNPVLDILANRTSVVVTFHERIAVFDARTLDDRLSVTTCFPSPGINPNPVTLGPRWLAYAEHKLIPAKRSGGGCDGDGVASYTATMLNAAKSFGKGLRELGEQVAAGLTGSTGTSGSSKNCSFDSISGGELKQPGVVTILDIKHSIKDYSPTCGTPMTGGCAGSDPIVAHFIAHSEALVAMEFDNSGMLLLTADRRGHDFHVFRIQPHPVGSSLAAVHHLYVLHRGDTSAKVQNIAFSLDSRWVAVSTLRGTTHVFPITPYGGPMGVRTHTSLHVVNKLSRFHRSAGLSADGRSNSPISHSESTTFVQSLQPYHNPTLPPFPRPTVVMPLAQLRQPFTLGSPPGSANLIGGGSGGVGGGIGTGGGGGVGGVGLGGKSMGVGAGSSASQRQRLSSLSDDNGKPLSVCAIFAKSRSWLLDPPTVTREAPHRMQRKAVDSLFVMAGHGALIQYDLDTKLASNVAKEKICDDTAIELEVEAKAQWNLGRRKDGSQEIMPPLALDNWLMRDRSSCILSDSTRPYDDGDDRGESWLSQVEIITHAGPHRRLWMGPQFVFKTYNTPSGSNLNHVDAEAVEVGLSKSAATTAAATRLERSSPLNMPLPAAGRSTVPVLIESGSYSSIEQSPKLMDRFKHEHLDSELSVTQGDSRLKEDLADAMRESPSASSGGAHKDTGRLSSADAASSDSAPFYDAIADCDHEHLHLRDDDDDLCFGAHRPSAAVAAALANALPNICSYEGASPGYESLESQSPWKPKASIEKVVNPLGTVTTVTAGMSAEVQTDILDEVVSQLAAEDCVIHENCDEALFRPVVAIFCDESASKQQQRQQQQQQQQQQQHPHQRREHCNGIYVDDAAIIDTCKPPEPVNNKLIVPVIAKEVDAELTRLQKQKQKQKSNAKARQLLEEQQLQQQFVTFSNINKMCKPPQLTTADADDGKVEVQKKNCSPKEDVKESPKLLMDSTRPVNDHKSPSADSVKKSIAPKIEETEADEAAPIEFKRMTPLPLKKTTNARLTAPPALGAKDSKGAEQCKDSAVVTPKVEAQRADEQLKIRTELLNVSNLVDSLKEINDDDHGGDAEDRERVAKVEESTKSPTVEQLPEAVEIYASPVKEKKSKKKSKSASNSNSESEEIIEVTVRLPKKLRAQESDREQAVPIKSNGSASNANSEMGETISKQAETDKKSVSKEKVEAAALTETAIGNDSNGHPMPKEIENSVAVQKRKGQLLEESEKSSSTLAPIDGKPESKELDSILTKVTVNSKAEEPSHNANNRKEELDISKKYDSGFASKNEASKVPCTTKWQSEQGLVQGQGQEKVKETQKEVQEMEGKGIITKQPTKSRKASTPITSNQKETVKLSPKKTPATPSLSPAKKHDGKEDRGTTKPPSTAMLDTSNLDDFPMLQPLGGLPPLPTLGPLEITTPLEPRDSLERILGKQKASPSSDTLSLINFESPKEELDITPPPRGFTERNLIFALCGSLHYENESLKCAGADELTKLSAFSLAQGNATVLCNDQSVADSKLIMESEDQHFLSLDQSSQETNTTNITNTTNEKFSSSANSSASEEIIVIEEKKMSKKQKRKRLQQQQQHMELMKQRGSGGSLKPDDEELRPLISMSDSQLESYVEHFGSNATGDSASIFIDETCFPLKKSASSTQLGISTTIANNTAMANSVATTVTDSDGAQPASTNSDENIFTLPNNASNKVLTKKLEQKFTLISAIEATASSSTSSAEESGHETSGGGSAQALDTDVDADVNATAGLGIGLGLYAVAATATRQTSPSIIATQSVSKKKTKRRKR